MDVQDLIEKLKKMPTEGNSSAGMRQLRIRN